MPEKYIRKPNVSCLMCGKTVYRRRMTLERNSGNVFCSMVCYGISCRKELPCAMCGKPMLAGLNKKTCSKACANTQRTGIKYKIGKPRDRVSSQRALKIRLLGIRESHCERCSYNKPEILHVHHKDRNRENNDLGNLELICPNCHYEEHYLKRSWLKGFVK